MILLNPYYTNPYIISLSYYLFILGADTARELETGKPRGYDLRVDKVNWKRAKAIGT